MRQLGGILAVVTAIAAFSTAVPSAAADSSPLVEPAVTPMPGASATTEPAMETAPRESTPVLEARHEHAFRHRETREEERGWFGGLHLSGNLLIPLDSQPQCDIKKAMERSGMSADFGRDNRYPDVNADESSAPPGFFEVAFDVLGWLRISGRYHLCPRDSGVGFVGRQTVGGVNEYRTVRETVDMRRSGAGIDLVLKKRRFFTTILGGGVDEWRISVGQQAPNSAGTSVYREIANRRVGGLVRTMIEFTPVNWLIFRASVMKSFVQPVKVDEVTAYDYSGGAHVLTAHEIDVSEVAVTFGLGVYL